MLEIRTAFPHRLLLTGLVASVLMSFGTAMAEEVPARSASDKSLLEERHDTGKTVIKIIQRKNFMKVDRFELTAYAGGETINPFVYQWVGGLGGTYHLTEVFALEAFVGYSPSLSTIAGSIFSSSSTIDNLDLKDLTIELENSASVRPSATKMGLYGHTGLVFSPLYGKFAFLSKRIVNFDVYFTFGMGAIQTRDLDKDLQGQPIEFDTTREVHATSTFGFGFRAALNEWMALRIEGREYFFVETITVGDASYNVEALNVMYYFMAQAGLSFFFPTSLN